MGHSDFRFGVNLTAPAARGEWMDKCRHAEELGYDTIAIPDHLGMPSPFPAMVLAAEATTHARIGTFVINTSFYNPTLLARDIVGTDQFTGGRIELGLGAGYVKAEFDKAGLEFGTPGQRIDRLIASIDELDRFCADPTEPNPVQEPIPLLIAGSGDRLLRLAARRASVVSFAGAGFQRDGTPFMFEASKLEERVQFVTAELGGREAEFNAVIMRAVVTDDRAAVLSKLAERSASGLSPEQMAECPMYMAGTPEQLADQLLGFRERFGFTYFTVLESSMEEFAAVIALMR